VNNITNFSYKIEDYDKKEIIIPNPKKTIIMKENTEENQRMKTTILSKLKSITLEESKYYLENNDYVLEKAIVEIEADLEFEKDDKKKNKKERKKLKKNLFYNVFSCIKFDEYAQF
jgi:hypothetical protein